MHACSITIEQKELLLNDVINKVTSEDTSLVEVAYELLVLRPRKEEHLEDISDFVDQCNVIAERLLLEGDSEEDQYVELVNDDDDDDEDEDEEEEDEEEREEEDERKMRMKRRR
jgi:TATA-binding protein-associated factor Taf7